MCVESSLVRFLSNAVTKLPCNYWERTWNIAVIKYFRMTLSITKMVITATEVVLIKLFSYTIVSKQKKNENTEYYGTFISFKSLLYSKQGSPVFLLFGSWSVILYLHVSVKSKVLPIFLASQF